MHKYWSDQIPDGPVPSASTASAARPSHPHDVQDYGSGTLSTGSVPPSSQLQTLTDTKYTPQESVPRSDQLADHTLDQQTLMTAPSISSAPQQHSPLVYESGNNYDRAIHQDHILAPEAGYWPEPHIRRGDENRFAEESFAGNICNNHPVEYEEYRGREKS